MGGENSSLKGGVFVNYDVNYDVNYMMISAEWTNFFALLISLN